MKTLVRWNPAREMLAWQRAFDRFFEENDLVEHPGMRSWNLALDVAETEAGYLVKASIPGMNPEDIDITLEDNVLTIKGETKVDETVQEADFHIRERRFGSFSRSLRLPVAVNADGIEATYEQGVLSLDIPKAEEYKPRRIAVRTNGKSGNGEIVDA